jgi:hypothetical protein
VMTTPGVETARKDDVSANVKARQTELVLCHQDFRLFR